MTRASCHVSLPQPIGDERVDDKLSRMVGDHRQDCQGTDGHGEVRADHERLLAAGEGDGDRVVAAESQAAARRRNPAATSTTWTADDGDDQQDNVAGRYDRVALQRGQPFAAVDRADNTISSTPTCASALSSDLVPRRPAADRRPLPQELRHDDRQHDEQQQARARCCRNSTSARMPTSSNSQAGMTMKHARFVIIVTRNATASLPPARRVHTAAEASVLGTVAARITPTAKFRRQQRLASQPSGGASPLLMQRASQAGPGCRTARHSTPVSSGSAMMNVTARITSPATSCATGRIAAGQAMPATRHGDERDEKPALGEESEHRRISDCGFRIADLSSDAVEVPRCYPSDGFRQ